MVTHERLIELFSYSQETGLFMRRIRVGRGLVGAIAGTPNPRYRNIQIQVDRRIYPAGRLAWLYMTGDLPAQCIDHIDGDPSNNRWSNLRLATKAQNGWNRGKNKNNSTGYKGVWQNATSFVAEITVKGSNIQLGSFTTAVDAHKAYMEAAHRYHKEFARF